MGILQNLSELYKDYQELREFRKTRAGINTLLSLASKQNNYKGAGLSSFFDNVSANASTDTGYLSAGSSYGLVDTLAQPQDLYNLVHKDTYYSGLFDSLIKKITKDGFYVRSRNRDITNKAKTYEKLLKKIHLKDIVEQYLYAIYGDGGGNALLFTSFNRRNQMEFKLESFYQDGRHRVRVIGDSRYNKILRYEIFYASSSAPPIYTFDVNSHSFTHLRFTSGGNYRFSTNPAKKAVYWFILKNNIAGANNSAFTRGLQEPTIQTPDYSSFAALINAVKENKESTIGGRPEYISDPIEYIKERGRLDDEIVRSMIGDPSRTNSLVKFKLPYKFEKIGRDNQNMQTIPLIKACDEQMGYVFRTSMGIVSTKDSKYANAEVERDNWLELVVDPVKKDIEELIETFILPRLDPLFDSDMFQVCYGRDPNQEDIEIYNAQTERNESIANILSILSKNPNYKYDLETNKIIELQEDVQNKDIGNADTVNEKVTNAINRQRSKKQELLDMIINAIESRDSQKFENLIMKTFEKQIRLYTDKIKNYENIDDAISNLGKDLTPFSTNGLNVATYRQQLLKFAEIGYDEFISATNERATKVVPQIIIDMMDAKAQLMLKGWEGLSNEQKVLIADVFEDKYRNYAGIDSETSKNISDILIRLRNSPPIDTGKTFIDDDGIEKPVMKIPGIEDAIKELLASIPELDESRARTIAHTDIAQAIEGARKKLYLDLYGDRGEKKWFTVGDSMVRQGHKDNEKDGWIGINKAFSSGADSTASEINCRCSVLYRERKDL